VSHERVRDLGPLQKLNHFPDMTSICHKASSAEILKRMSRFFPREYQFFPQSWTLPRDLGLLHKFLSSPPEQGKPPPTVIVKPNKGCQVGAPPRERGGESARARERERSRAVAAVRCGCARPGEPTPPRIIASRARTRLSHPCARLSRPRPPLVDTA
jgi:hypothetical protein